MTRHAHHACSAFPVLTGVSDVRLHRQWVGASAGPRTDRDTLRFQMLTRTGLRNSRCKSHSHMNMNMAGENALHHSAHHTSHNHALALSRTLNNPASFTPSITMCRWCHRSKATASSGPPNHGNVGQCLRTTRCCRLDPASECHTHPTIVFKTTVYT
jgi:hypothetical protein